MKKLKEQLYKNGYNYIMQKRTAKTAMYAQYILDDIEKPIMYEVFRVFITKANKLPNGTISPDHETFPSDSVFGKWAWTYTNLEDAEKRFVEIESKETK